MTDLATRTDTAPVVIDGAFTEPAVAPGTPVYVRNPHQFPLYASVALTAGSMAGFGWTTYRDDPHAGLSFLALLIALAVLVVQWRRFNAWDA